MKTTVSRYDFCEAFNTRNRSENFTHAGLQNLFDYLESIEESTGEEIELDVIGICCEYTEYENIAEYNRDYRTSFDSHNEVEHKITENGDSFIAHAH